MSANVWFEEVNTGLKAEIMKHVKIVDKTGSPILIPDKNVVVRKPEEDFKIEVFPCVSIYNKDYDHNKMRYAQDPVKISYNKELKIVEMEETAVPFDLFYQIDFWARYQSDMDLMTRTWLIRHFRQFNLPVVDDGGMKRTVNCMRTEKIVKSDLTLNKERLFHSIINYEIWVALDDETRYNMPVVVTHEVDAKQKEDKKGESEDG